MYTVKANRLDPWKAVAAACDGLVSTASTHADQRGAFVGFALRPPPTGDACPHAMALATESDEFGIELVALLARWGILR